MTKYEKDIHKKTDEMIERLPGGFVIYHADEAEEIITFNGGF